jgi:hypothetical protein
MKKLNEFYDRAKNDYGYTKRQIYNYVIIQATLIGLDEKVVSKYLDKKLKEDGA